MKQFIYISFLMFFTTQLFAQEWRDSLNVARDAYNNKEYGKAIHYYKSAQKNAPEGVDFSKEIAQSAYKNLQFDEAEKIYREQASSENKSTEKAKAYHNLGNSLMQQKKYGEAVDAYKQSLRQNPDSDKTRHNLTESMRLLKEQQQQQQNKQDQEKDEKEQNQEQQDQQKQNNQQNQKDGKQQNQSQNQQQKSGSNDSQNAQNGNSKLQDKAVEKKLDDLMKQESETKRRMSQGNSSRGYSKTGKDW